MKKLTINIVLGFLCLFGKVSAQDTENIKPLKKGDELPSLTFTKLINSKAKEIRTDDYKEQLLIIDFWSTSCTSCIKMFPTIEELQKGFDGKVKFLAIDSWKSDTEQKLKTVFNRHPEWTFPTVYSDDVATKLFPHEGIPYYVWIKNNKVLAMTGIEAIHADTIAAVLKGTLRPTDQQNLALNLNRPIYFAGNGGEPSQYVFRSLLTPYHPGFRNQIMRSNTPKGETDRLLFLNHTAYYLIRSAYPQLGRVNENRIMTSKSIDPAFFGDSSSFQWNSKHRFTYEAIFPPRSREQALQLMQEDMRRYFALTVDSSIIERECLVFKSSKPHPQKDKRLPQGKVETNWYTPESNIPITFGNYPLSEILQLFDEVSDVPVIDETGSDALISISLKKAAVDEQELRAALNKYGITLKREKRMIRMYVIRRVDESIIPQNLNQP